MLLALVVLGPEKLPEAIRRFGRLYGELKRMSTGFQSEFRTAFEEPMRELRETAQLTREAVHQATSGELDVEHAPQDANDRADEGSARHDESPTEVNPETNQSADGTASRSDGHST